MTPSPPQSTAQTHQVVVKLPRATIACETCRSRKVKCSGERPVCKACRRHNQDCVYASQIKRRRRSTKPTDKQTSPKIQSQGGAPPLTLNTADLSSDNHQFNQSFPFSQSISNGSNVPLQIPDLSTSLNNNVNSTFTVPTSLESYLDLDDLLAFDPVNTTNFNTTNSANDLSAFTQYGQTPSSSGISPSARARSKLKLPYFRFFGPTAIAPGYKQVVSDISAPPSPRPTRITNEASQIWGLTAGTSDNPNDGESPSAQTLAQLLPVFHLHFGYVFPFFHFANKDTNTIAQTYPSYLLNIICALASIYSDFYNQNSASNLTANSSKISSQSAHWASKAKEQACRNLAVSSVELVQTLMLIGWYEFAQERDSGLWMYAGMAFRMIQDLGMEPCSVEGDTGTAPDADSVDNVRLGYALRILDSVLTIGTGRMGYFKAEAAIVRLPDLPTNTGKMVPDPYPQVIKIMSVANKITRIWVKREDKYLEELQRAQSDLNDFYAALPFELRFETSSFQMYASIAQGGAFVLLHLWFHLLIILTHQPSLFLHRISNERTEDADKGFSSVAASSAKTILDIAVFAELIDPKAISQPWINYPIYTAGRSFLSQSIAARNTGHNGDDSSRSAGEVHMEKLARSNFQRIIAIFDNLEKYWQGVRYIRSALLQMSDGIEQVSLVQDGDPDQDVWGDLAQLLGNTATDTQNGAALGLSMTGTLFNSPSDKQYNLVYPPISGGNNTAGELLPGLNFST